MRDFFGNFTRVRQVRLKLRRAGGRGSVNAGYTFYEYRRCKKETNQKMWFYQGFLEIFGR
jgi:hypothetical protein